MGWIRAGIFLFGFFNSVSSYAVTLTKLSDMDFNLIDFSIVNNSGDIRMGTDGNIIYTGLLGGNGFGVTSRIRINETAGTVVTIGCRKNGKIADSSGTFLTVRTVAVMGTANVTSYDNSTLCNGLNKVIITHTMTGDAAQDTLVLGGKVNPSNNKPPTNDIWKTTNQGGNVLKIRVKVQ